MQQELKQVYRYGFALLSGAALFLFTAFLLWPYQKLQIIFGQFNGEKETLYPWNNFSGTYGFSESAYWLAVITYGSIFILSVFLYFQFQGANPFTSKNSFFLPYQFFRQRLKSTWQSIPLWEKKVVIFSGVLLVLVRLYFLFTSRIGGDESASYIFFISKGLPGILFYYPIPNNHIFYNLLCLPLTYVFKDPYWIVELPTFCLSLFGSALIYLAYRSVFPFLVIFFGTATFCFSQYSLFFSVHGRGYFLINICAALVALSLFKIYRRQQDYYWLIVISSSIIGFYTIPVFLYPFVSIVFFAAIVFFKDRNWLAIKQLIVAGFFIGFVVLVVYSPILMASGLSLLLGNDYVASNSINSYYPRFLSFLIYTQGSIIGQESLGFYIWLLGFGGITGMLLFRNHFKSIFQTTGLNPGLLFMIWCSLTLPWVFIFLQRVSPPERVLAYKGFFDLLAIGIVLYIGGLAILKRNSRWIAIFFFIFISGFCGYQINKSIRNERVALLDKGFDSRIDAIVKSGAKVYFGTQIYYTAHLRYQYAKLGISEFILNEYQFKPERRYDVLILDKRKAIPADLSFENYQVVFEDNFVTILYSKAFLSKNGQQKLILN